MKKHKLLIAVIMFGLTWAGMVRAEDQPIEQQTKPTILLVHGAWADFFKLEWRRRSPAQRRLHRRALPEYFARLSADAAVISTYLKSVAGPVGLVGHSYGGSVISITSANAPNVKALVFVDAFAPDAGESVQSGSRATRRRRRISRLRYPSRHPTAMEQTCTSIPNTSEWCLHLRNRRMSRRG